MSNEAYTDYRERYFNPGSSLYYSCLYLPETVRDALIDLQVFFAEIRHISLYANNAEVSHLRLQWWHQELGALYSGSPRHPISHALLAHIQSYNLSQNEFNSIVAASVVLLKQEPFQDSEQLFAYAQRSYAALYKLRSACLSPGTETPKAFFVHLANAHCLIDLLTGLHLDKTHNRCSVPQTMRDTHKLTPDCLLQHPTPPTLDALLIDLCVSCQKELDECIAQIRAHPYNIYPHFHIQLHLLKATVNKIRRKRRHLLFKNISLTPIYKYWISWHIFNKISDYE